MRMISRLAGIISRLANPSRPDVIILIHKAPADGVAMDILKRPDVRIIGVVPGDEPVRCRYAEKYVKAGYEHIASLDTLHIPELTMHYLANLLYFVKHNTHLNIKIEVVEHG